MITLRGMTWNHPRGIDPLRAHARAYRDARDVDITWDARSLEDFEAFPLDELAGQYDLLVIDHPHVGMAAASGCLLPLDGLGRDDALAALRDQSVGGSHQTYHYAERQWALAIDAAAQVSARREGTPGPWPRTWDDVLKLARDGRVMCPLAPVHAMMCLYTLCANSGTPCAPSGAELVDPSVGERVLSLLRQLASALPRDCFEMNPIAVFEKMADDDRFLYCPLIYGYVSYARDGFRPARIDFADIPGVRGSALGGTGIAVSTQSANRQAAIDVAFDLAGEPVQRGLYASNGGQPAHRAAWLDPDVNAPVHGFYQNTLTTLDAAYVRPRFDGYIAFQQSAGLLVAACLKSELPISSAIARINLLFADAQHLTP